jgi:hypothetical protein
MKTPLRRIILILTVLHILSPCGLYANDRSHNYIDVPIFNILPNDKISEVFSLFGKSKIYETQLAHNYVLYFDSEKGTALIFYVYQSDNETLWTISLRKVQNGQKIQDIHKIASLMRYPKKYNDFKAPAQFRIGEKLTVKGLKFDMSPKQVEALLKVALPLKDSKAYIRWDIRERNEIMDYGGIEFIFKENKLISLSWFGVDP